MGSARPPFSMLEEKWRSKRPSRSSSERHIPLVRPVAIFDHGRSERLCEGRLEHHFPLSTKMLFIKF